MYRIGGSVGWGVFGVVGVEIDKSICDWIKSDVGNDVEIGYGGKVELKV